jgi:hypothetical protein
VDPAWKAPATLRNWLGVGPVARSRVDVAFVFDWANDLNGPLHSASVVRTFWHGRREDWLDCPLAHHWPLNRLLNVTLDDVALNDPALNRRSHVLAYDHSALNSGGAETLLLVFEDVAS